ncbi:hypothetical protein NEOLI_005266 [Neolecta irregularis DAH-3]|uniref:Uncharacterized protein n=1 Tax=Neolecta irregularis (strain DAH-3) TaxID=1198029 RepID=A0A1U7LKQ5_NEOID|nr:hypothetical protein NEOLI_005266 [Neolecta irregularis DAH-3]|eukprot:OLL23218.1 hypothetical protein NEOLI_005266 [Neolecta irregularis DAH-3]
MSLFYILLTFVVAAFSIELDVPFYLRSYYPGTNTLGNRLGSAANNSYVLSTSYNNSLVFMMDQFVLKTSDLVVYFTDDIGELVATTPKNGNPVTEFILQEYEQPGLYQLELRDQDPFFDCGGLKGIHYTEPTGYNCTLVQFWLEF